MKIEIRNAEPIDMVALLAFDTFPGDRIVEIVERRMLVVEVSGMVVGYVAWHPRGFVEKQYVNKLVVRDDHRRLGLASRLLDALQESLSGSVFISAGTNNPAAVAFLCRCGWSYVGKIVGLIEDEEAEMFYKKRFSLKADVAV